MGNPATVPVFHSGGNQSVPEAAQAGHRRCVRARKRAHIVQVRFAEHACEVRTLEGIVHAETGMELGKLIEPVKATLTADDPLATAEELRAAVLSAVSLILDEHQDWHMLVRPHHLPLG